jgi:hypothetical protein
VKRRRKCDAGNKFAHAGHRHFAGGV